MTTLPISESNSTITVVPQPLMFGKRKRSKEFQQEVEEIKRIRNFAKGNNNSNLF
jgi:hypothetical protein